AAVPSADGRRQLPARLARRPRRGRGGRARGGRVRADESARADDDPTGPRWARRRPGAPLPPVFALLAAGLEPVREAVGRTVPRADRRAPLQRLDVPAAARRRPLDDDPRPRPAPVP